MSVPARGYSAGTVHQGPEILESARRLDTIALAKTGTVTSGQFPGVVDSPAVLVASGEQPAQREVAEASG